MLVATCPHCPGLNVACVDEAHQAKVKARHDATWHADLPPETDELCEALVTANPDDFAVVEMAFRTAAAKNNGQVDQNYIRSILPTGLNPRVVSAAYRVCRMRARHGGSGLVKVGTNISDDRAGRNAGREQPLYAWVEAERTQTA